MPCRPDSILCGRHTDKGNLSWLALLTPLRTADWQIQGEILAHSVPVKVLGVTGLQRSIPKNNSKTVSMRRYRPYGALATNENTKNRWVIDDTAHILTEGVTPTADTLVPDNVEVTLQQYGCLYEISDQATDTYGTTFRPNSKAVRRARRSGA